MIDRDVALEALSVICNAKVTSVQKQRSDAGLQTTNISGGAAQPLLFVRQLVLTVLDGDETCQVSRSNFARIQNLLVDGVQNLQVEDQAKTLVPTTNLQVEDRVRAFGAPNNLQVEDQAKQICRSLDFDKDETGKIHIIDESEFFDPGYDYDFTHLKDTNIYYRGEEVYERPCGWSRFALKVLDKYEENTWLGNPCRTTQSVEGEWPVSYHGTSQEGAECVIEGGLYKPGSGQVHGRGIYSTPYISEAMWYSKTFTSKKTGKTYRVILQNRINPKYREICKNVKYWLVRIPEGTSKKKEREMVDRAIRPYGLLVQEV